MREVRVGACCGEGTRVGLVGCAVEIPAPLDVPTACSGGGGVGGGGGGGGGGGVQSGEWVRHGLAIGSLAL